MNVKQQSKEAELSDDVIGAGSEALNVIGNAARRLIENVENSPTTPHHVGGLHGRLGRGAVGLSEG